MQKHKHRRVHQTGLITFACMLAMLSACGGGSSSPSVATPAAEPVTWNAWDHLLFNGEKLLAGNTNADLQLYYTFEEATGTVTADLSGNNYSANIVPFDETTQLGTLWRGGHNGNGVLMSEAGRVSVEQDLVLDLALSGNALAISCWYALSDTTTDGNFRLVSKKQVDFQLEGFELELNPALKRLRFIGQTEEYIDADIPASAMDNGWHHVVFSLENGAGSIRLDGIDITKASANTLSNPLIVQSADPLSIGALSNGSTPAVASFPGTIDDLRVYSAALTISEQVQLFTDDQSQRGLIAWWQLDETTGTTFIDSSGFGHDATGVDVTAAGTGRINTAVSFDTADSRLNAGGGLSMALTSQMSLSAWVRIDDTEQDYYMRILSKKETDTDAAGFEFAYYPKGNNLIFNGGGGRTAAASVTLDTNWHHLAASVNGTSVQFYVDGVALTTVGSIETPLQSTRPLYIGHRATDASTLPGAWLGDLDDVRVYAHALSTVELQSIYNESANNIPVLTISNPRSDMRVVYGDTLELLATAIDTEDGNISADIEWNSNRDGALGNGAFISTTTLSYGQHTITGSVSDSDGAVITASRDIVIVSAASSQIKPSIATVLADSAWQTVTTAETYVNPIVLCAANYDDSQSPAVVRVRNASGNTFEMKVQNPSGIVLSNYSVHYIVVEEGVYNETDHGVDLEALRFQSTRTDHAASWVAEKIEYAHAYSNPVILGQVASEHDSQWSTFWSRGSAYSNPVSSTVAYIGKHVAEDSNIVRANEELHYIVLNAGDGFFAGMAYHAGIGGDQVAGVDDAPAYDYTVNNVLAASVGMVSSSGMDGTNGGWPILYGSNAVSADNLGIAIDEDQIGDSERNHTTEQIAFLVLADPGAPGISLLTPSAQSVHLEGEMLTLTATAVDPEDGDISASAEWVSNINGAIGTGATLNTTTLSPGFHTIIVSVNDSSGKSASDSIDIVVMSLAGPQMETGIITDASDAWQTIDVGRSFHDMAVFCSVSYDHSALPAVARVRNAGGTSFELRVQNPSDAALSNYTVHYQVFETGVYRDAEHGITMEICTFLSDSTDNNTKWLGRARHYYNIYNNPVVLGQVMTANDSRWSVFWARGASQGVAPSAGSLFVGKHLGEDSDRERVAETLAYMVIESGTGMIDGASYVAGLGNDSVLGVGDSPAYTYPLSMASTQSALVSRAGIDGGNGGWPVLYGANPLTPSQLDLAIDEDQIGDSERNHTSEQVGYLILGAYPVTYMYIESKDGRSGADYLMPE